MRDRVRGVDVGGERSRLALLTALALCLLAATALPEAVGASSTGRGSATSYYGLVQYPGDGFRGVYAQIAGARRSIDMEMYELQDPVAEHNLAAAAGRGVHVRVLLDRAFNGAAVNRDAADYLAAHRVRVRWAPAGTIFHIKVTTFDATTSDISTANLESKYYPTTRDAEIVVSDPVQVNAIEQTFSNDWTAGASGTPAAQTVQAPGLIWSPNTGSGTAQDAQRAPPSSSNPRSCQTRRSNGRWRTTPAGACSAAS